LETPLLLQDFTFESGSIGIMGTRQEKGEIWVYMPVGAQRLTIKHGQLGLVRDYPFGESLREATVYIMKLKSGNVKTIVEDNVNLQYLVVNCSIAGATIKIDGNLSESFSNGTFQKLLAYGKHQYTIEAPMYHPLNGQIEIKATEKSYLTPDLQPAFAMITLTADGDIYVNDVLKSTNTWSDRFMPGLYKVEVKKAAHRPSVTSIEVKAGEDKTIPLQAPAPIYGSLNITSNVVDAALLIDGVKQKETTPAIIKNVLIGSHTVELQANNKNEKQTVTVQEGKITEVNLLFADVEIENAKAWNRQGVQAEKQKNYAEALRLYQNSANQGYAPAQYNLGLLYEFGYGVKQDKAEARKWYQKAATQGVKEAKDRLKTL
jgi:hypothetical protein